eukprot:g377.t1
MAWGKQKRGIDDLLQRISAGDTTLSSLCILSTRRFGDADAVTLARLLQGQEQERSCGDGVLRELRASGHALGTEGAAALGAALGDPQCSLQCLDIGDASFGDVGVQALADAVTAAAAIASAAKVPKSLHVHLEFKNIGEDGARALAPLLRLPVQEYTTSWVHTLLLARNALGSAGAQALAHALATDDGMSSSSASGSASAHISAWGSALALGLRVLDLRENGIGHEGAVALARVFRLRSRHPRLALRLRRLLLGDNPLFGCLEEKAGDEARPALLNDGDVSVAKAGASTVALSAEAEIADSASTTAGLANVLLVPPPLATSASSTLSSLRELHLDHTGVDNEGACGIASMLRADGEPGHSIRLGSLSLLALGGCAIGVVGARDLVSALVCTGAHEGEPGNVEPEGGTAAADINLRTRRFTLRLNDQTPALGDAAVVAMAQAISTTAAIGGTATLVANSIGDRQAKNDCDLELDLDLSGNSVGSSGVAALASAVHHCWEQPANTIECSDEGTTSDRSALTSAPAVKLVALRLHNNSVGDEGARMLAPALERVVATGAANAIAAHAMSVVTDAGDGAEVVADARIVCGAKPPAAPSQHPGFGTDDAVARDDGNAFAARGRFVLGLTANGITEDGTVALLGAARRGLERGVGGDASAIDGVLLARHGLDVTIELGANSIGAAGQAAATELDVVARGAVDVARDKAQQ